MARADAASFSRVVIVAPRTRVDVALPADLPLVELLPMLLDMVGERSPDGGAQHDGWVLAPVAGDPLDPARTLRSLDILDGTALTLRPGRSVVAEPIFDDVVDAIAASVRSVTDDRQMRDLTGALAAGAGLLLAAFVVIRGPHTLAGASLASLAAAAALTAATGIVRSGGSRLVAVTVAASGAAAAYAAGLSVPGDPVGYPGVLLAASSTFVYAVLAGMLVRTGIVVMTTIATVAGFTLPAALAGIGLSSRPAFVTMLVGAVALAAITILPWFAVRLARLPLPVIPTTPDELRDSALGVDFAAVGARAAVAAEYLDGATIGCAVVAGAGATVALAEGTTMATLFGAAVVVALLLRVRSVVGRLPRLGLVVAGLSAAGLGLGWVALTLPEQTLPIASVTLVLVTIAILVTVFRPRRTLSPMTSRAIDITENLVLVAVLPLALGAVDLYSVVRHW